MKTITIRVNEDLHKALKMKIAQEVITLKDYILNLIENDLQKDKNKEDNKN